MFEKSTTELEPKPKQKLLRCKSTVHIATLNVWTLNRIRQPPDMTASVVEHNIGILCIQENWYYHSQVEIKYHETGNGWTFFSASTWKNSMNAIIGGKGMVFSRLALKSLNSIEKIQSRGMVAAFTGKPRITIICYSSTHASDETDLITFYNEISSLIRSIPKHNVPIIGGEMNAQIGKDENNKFFSYISPNRNWEHLTKVSLENRLTCLKTKFQKRKGKL